MIKSITLSLLILSELCLASHRLLLQHTHSVHPEELPLPGHALYTEEPTTTVAPVAPPPGYVLGAFGQVCPETEFPYQNKCPTITDMLSDMNGRVICDKPGQCCMCHSIQCGFGATKCKRVRFGNQAAFGVAEIAIAGNPTTGSVVHCNGLRSCQMATITGDNIITVDCDGNRACQFAHIVITDPLEQFTLDCGGVSSCEGLKMEINFSAPPAGFECRNTGNSTVFEIAGIECGHESACNGAEIVINNRGCDTVHVKNIECTHLNACNEALFEFFGDVKLQTCQCGPSGACDTAVGLDTCYPALPRPAV